MFSADDVILEAERVITFAYVDKLHMMDVHKMSFCEAQELASKIGQLTGMLTAQEEHIRDQDVVMLALAAIPDWIDECPFSPQERIRIRSACMLAFADAYLAETRN